MPEEVLNMKNVEYGGTGFYYDKAPKLPDDIEHISLIIIYMMIL